MEMGCHGNSTATTGCIPRLTAASILLSLLLFCSYLSSTEAYDSFNSNGNITIKWDVMTWTPDGYVAVVTVYNFQRNCDIQAPGWRLGWTWTKNEVIWAMFGAKTTEKGDCSRFRGNIPYNCEKYPTIVDLPPNTPYNMQVANCCKGGVLKSWGQDPTNYAASFQITVGAAGTTNRTVKMPRNYSLKAPGQGYKCGAKIVQPSRFVTPDGRRVTQALMTWKVTCTYSQSLSQKTSCFEQSSGKGHSASGVGSSLHSLSGGGS